MKAAHAGRALRAITVRELTKFVQQPGRMLSAMVRPGLWLLVFAAGFQNVLGVSIVEPYRTYVTYQEYVLPGLVGMVLLFNGMQSSLAMVYDREMGTMRMILTAPLPRMYLLVCKLLAGTVLSTAQAYLFLAVAAVFGIAVPWTGWATALPAIFLAGLMLGAIGLLLSVTIRQMENFAGTMNFVVFPMFFVSTSLLPLWKLRESGADWLYLLAQANPFTHAVELIRFAAYGQLQATSLLAVLGIGSLAFAGAVLGYDPQRGLSWRNSAIP